MTLLGIAGGLALALAWWRADARRKRRERRAAHQLARFHAQADERAAAAALRPFSGQVAASVRQPPMNGNGP